MNAMRASELQLSESILASSFEEEINLQWTETLGPNRTPYFY